MNKKTQTKRNYYVNNHGKYIHTKSGKEIIGEELKILKELEDEGLI